MDLEFQQLELRYERLRLPRPGRERQLLSSLAGAGQQVPIVVVADSVAPRFIVIDGYKRVRCLRKLAQDTVLATRLDLGELEALVMSHQMSSADGETALEQAWLLDELERRFGLTQDQLARRFDRSVSWVSRRLALVRELPDSVQERVRSGEIVAHGAVKYLVPLARAKRSDCEGLVAAVADARLSSRDLGHLYTAWRDGTAKTRERLLAAPLVFLKAIREAQAGRLSEPGPGQKLLNDVDMLGAIARRAHRQLREGAGQRLLPGEGEEILRCFEQSQVEVRRLAQRLDKEVADVGPGGTPRDPGTVPAGGERARDRPDDGGVAAGGAEDPAGGLGGSAAVGASAEGGAVPRADPGTSHLVQGQPGASP
jgi:ParB/RepB/Spo0J family partition protein